MDLVVVVVAPERRPVGLSVTSSIDCGYLEWATGSLRWTRWRAVDVEVIGAAYPEVLEGDGAKRLRAETWKHEGAAIQALGGSDDAGTVDPRGLAERFGEKVRGCKPSDVAVADIE